MSTFWPFLSFFSGTLIFTFFVPFSLSFWVLVTKGVLPTCPAPIVLFSQTSLFSWPKAAATTRKEMPPYPSWFSFLYTAFLLRTFYQSRHPLQQWAQLFQNINSLCFLIQTEVSSGKEPVTWNHTLILLLTGWGNLSVLQCSFPRKLR